MNKLIKKISLLFQTKIKVTAFLKLFHLQKGIAKKQKETAFF